MAIQEVTSSRQTVPEKEGRLKEGDARVIKLTGSCSYPTGTGLLTGDTPLLPSRSRNWELDENLSAERPFEPAQVACCRCRWRRAGPSRRQSSRRVARQEQAHLHAHVGRGRLRGRDQRRQGEAVGQEGNRKVLHELLRLEGRREVHVRGASAREGFHATGASRRQGHGSEKSSRRAASHQIE